MSFLFRFASLGASLQCIPRMVAHINITYARFVPTSYCMHTCMGPFVLQIILAISAERTMPLARRPSASALLRLLLALLLGSAYHLGTCQPVQDPYATVVEDASQQPQQDTAYLADVTANSRVATVSSFQPAQWPYDSCFRGEGDSPYELVYSGKRQDPVNPGVNQVCMQVRVARLCDGLGPTSTGPAACCAALSDTLWKFEIEAGQWVGLPSLVYSTVLSVIGTDKTVGGSQC